MAKIGVDIALLMIKDNIVNRYKINRGHCLVVTLMLQEGCGSFGEGAEDIYQNYA